MSGGRSTGPPVGDPKDIAAAVSFAVSADVGWTTGSTIDVAGGVVF